MPVANQVAGHTADPIRTRKGARRAEVRAFCGGVNVRSLGKFPLLASDESVIRNCKWCNILSSPFGRNEEHSKPFFTTLMLCCVSFIDAYPLNHLLEEVTTELPRRGYSTEGLEELS